MGAALCLAIVQLRWWLFPDSVGRGHFLLPLILPIVLAATLGGLATGLVTTLAALVAGHGLMDQATFSFRLTHSDETVRLATLATCGVVISMLGEALQRSRKREQALWRHRVRQEQTELAALQEVHQAMQVVQARLATVLESAGDAIVLMDNSLKVLMVNPAAQRMFKVSAASMEGTQAMRWVPDRHQVCLERWLRGVDQHGSVTVQTHPLSQMTLCAADGTEFKAETSTSSAHVDGRLMFTTVLRDVSDRLAAERALKSSHHRLLSSLEAMNDGVLLCDPQGQVTLYNQALVCFFYGTPAQNFLGPLERFTQFVEVAELNGSPAPVNSWGVFRALRGESGARDYRFRRIDTGQTWLGQLNHAPVRDSDGTITGAVVVTRDVTDERRMQLELASSESNLHRLIAQMTRVEEEERKRLARELHDDLQQTLGVIKMEVEVSLRCTDVTSSTVQHSLQRTVERIDETIDATRRILRALRPKILDDLGLLAALESLGSTCRAHGIDFELELLGQEDASDIQLDPQVANCLFRVAQEAITNARKHALAHSIYLCLDLRFPNAITLDVVDDGLGLSAEALNKGGTFGILGMKERLRALGGVFSVQALEGRGTQVRACVPRLTIEPLDNPQVALPLESQHSITPAMR